MVPYNAAVSALSRANWQLALQLLTFVVTRRLQINVVTIAAAATALDKAGNWQLALLLLLEAQATNLSNIISYGAAISACEQNEEWQQALELLASMVSADLQANAVVYSATARIFPRFWHVILYFTETLKKSWFGCRCYHQCVCQSQHVAARSAIACPCAASRQILAWLHLPLLLLNDIFLYLIHFRSPQNCISHKVLENT